MTYDRRVRMYVLEQTCQLIGELARNYTLDELIIWMVSGDSGI